MLEQPNASAYEQPETHQNLPPIATVLECNRTRFYEWLPFGLLLLMPLLFWFYLSHTVPAPMAPLYTLVQAGIVTIVLLNALISWEALRVEHLSLRLTYATLFITGGIFMAMELVFQNHRPAQSPYIDDFMTSHLVSTAQVLLAAALFMVALRLKGPIRWRIARSNVMPWITGILIAAIALFTTSRLQGWGAAIPWERAVPAIFTMLVAGLYGCTIFVTWLAMRNRPHRDTADYILAILLLSVAAAVQIIALISRRNLVLLNQFYQLAGFAWVLRYSFMVGFREPYERLKQSAAQFQTLFEKNGEVTLLLDPESGTILDCNEAAVEFYGYSRVELKKLHIWDINILPQSTVQERMREVSSRSGAHFHFQHRLRNGNIREVDVYSVALNLGSRNVIYDVIRDDTERSKALTSLSLFSQAIEASANGIIITDASASDTPIVYVNPAFEKLTGYSLEEVRGKNPRLLQGPAHDNTGREEIRAAVKAQRPGYAILKNYRKDATPYWCEVNISPVRDRHGTVTHWVGIQSDITARRAAEEKLEYLAFYDPLTGIPNRRLLLDRIKQAAAVANRNGNYGALVFLDLDQFKQINDAQGHDVGDTLLIAVVDRIRLVLRGSDTLGRNGGDEFIIILPDLSPDQQQAADDLKIVLQRISDVLTEPIKIGPAEYSIFASMGVTLFPQENISPADLITQADIAMYRAKEAGRNTICHFEPAMQEQVTERARLTHNLRDALQHGDFRVFLQPQVDDSGRIIGAEALIRWQHQQGGLIGPAKFIPVAEETGLIVPMGEFMLREACKILRQLQCAGVNFRLSVNVSLRQFRMVDFPERIIAIVKDSQINPANLTLEITESVLLHDAKGAVEKMHKINAFGIGFSIDDFGTGFSSLGYLQRLPLNELKIDRSFICDVATNANDGALVEAIIAIAHHHRLRVVAEGIETSEQFEYLKSRGCPLYQGYLFGRPVPAQELLATLLSPQHAAASAEASLSTEASGVTVTPNNGMLT